MKEYAPCPGLKFDGTPCPSLVIDSRDNSTNFCCVPCFQTTWEPIEAQAWNKPDFVPVDHGHSDQCGVRQARRGQEVPGVR